MRRADFQKLMSAIDSLSMALNGGKGSGNWGHAGRPGRIGGSGKGSKISGMAKERLAEAKKHEPQTTKDLKQVVKDAKCRLEGLEFRVKELDSLSRKIMSDAKEGDSPLTIQKLKDASKKIHDNLRYTAIASEDNFLNQYSKMKKNLESKGYEFVKIKNTMADTKGDYKGVNCQLRNKDGYIFELQFHTKDSFDAKMKAHDDYAIARNEKRSEEARVLAVERMKKLYDNVPVPQGAEKIKSISKL